MRVIGKGRRKAALPAAVGMHGSRCGEARWRVYALFVQWEASCKLLDSSAMRWAREVCRKIRESKRVFPEKMVVLLHREKRQGAVPRQGFSSPADKETNKKK